MKAIVTKYHGATNTRGSRISATAEGGNRISIAWNYGISDEENHRQAAMKLCAKLNWLSTPLISGGGLPNGQTVHMFSTELKEAIRILLITRRTLGGLAPARKDEGLRGCEAELDAYFSGIGHKHTEGEQ